MIVAGCSLSEAKGAPRTVCESMALDADGIRGDRHAGPGLRQVSLMAAAVIHETEKLAPDAPLPVGAGHENVVIENLEQLSVRVLDRFRVGSAMLEVTQLGAAWRPGGKPLCQGTCMVSDHGVFCRVVEPGIIRDGDAVDHAARALRVQVVTMSDRASPGRVRRQVGSACGGADGGVWRNAGLGDAV